MPKPYIKPLISSIYSLPEGQWRALLTPLLLAPPRESDPLFGVYVTACETLFAAECRASLHTLQCFIKGVASPQRYAADLHRLLFDLLTAVQVYLQPHGYSLSFTLHGTTTYAAVCPRYLLMGITALLRSALDQSKTAHVTADATKFSFTIDTALHGTDIQFPRAVAALHGGRLLQSDTKTVLSFCPQKTITVYPRWQSPGIDGFLRDPLSCIRTAFCSHVYSAFSS